MSDTVMRYRSPRDRGLATLYAVLREEDKAVVAATGSLVDIVEADWADYAYPMSDAAVPYLYEALPHAASPAADYTLEIFQAATPVGINPVVYDIDDPQVGVGPFAWRGPTQVSPPPSGALEDIRSQVQTDLGGSGIDVELSDADYLAFLRAALRELNRARPQRAWNYLSGFVSTTMRYSVVHPAVLGITDVQVVGSRDNCGDCQQVVAIVTPFGNIEPGSFDVLGYPIPGDMPGNWEMARQFRETVRQQSGGGNEIDWTSRREAGALYLYVTAPADSSVAYEYTWGITPDDDADTGVANIPPGDLQWVIDFTRARAKQALGRILGKHGGINLPGGGTESMDSDALRQEGREDELNLKDAMRTRRRPILPEVG